MTENLRLGLELVDRILMKELRPNQEVKIAFEKALEIKENCGDIRLLDAIIKVFKIEENDPLHLQKVINVASKNEKIDLLMATLKKFEETLEENINRLKKTIEIIKNVKNRITTKRQKTE